MSIPKIGIGTYRLNPETTYRIVLEGLKLGYRHIDTAALYRNEEAVKKAIEDSKIPRDEIFVTTKIHVDDIKRWRVREAFMVSLKKLGKIDLVLLHGPVACWLRGWKELVKIQKEGLVSEIGVSNFRVDELDDCEVKPKYNQIEITPFLPRFELVKYCAEHKIQIIAHSSLTKGFAFKNKILVEMAKRLDSTPAQILLSWGVQRGFCVLPRTSNIVHLRENRKIIEIPPVDMEKLNNTDERMITHRRWS
jgi:diketogulonate reductase-like aldo/keto reductase